MLGPPLAALLWASATVAGAPALVPSPVATESPGETAQRLAMADGQIYLFRSNGQAFEAIGHKLSAISTPPLLAELLPAQAPFSAAVSRDGRWIFSGGYGAVLVVDGDEVSEILAPGLAQGVAFWDGEPVAHFTPGQDMSRHAAMLEDEPDEDSATAWLAYDSRKKRWTAHGLEDVSDTLRPGMTSYYRAGVILSSDGKGGLWIANEYQYRLRRLSAGGKRLLEVELPISVPIDPESQERAEDALLALALEKGMDPEKLGTAKITAAPGKPIVTALAGDGSTGYLLWRMPDDPKKDEGHLDRVQAGQIERVKIRFPGETAAASIRSMAIDRHGLMLAQHKGRIWSISAEDLLAAEWELVEPGKVEEPRSPSG